MPQNDPPLRSKTMTMVVLLNGLLILLNTSVLTPLSLYSGVKQYQIIDNIQYIGILIIIILIHCKIHD